MLTYRFYVLEGGHVREPPQIYECPDDEAAAETAAQLSNRRMIEVWDRSRLVFRAGNDGCRSYEETQPVMSLRRER